MKITNILLLLTLCLSSVALTVSQSSDNKIDTSLPLEKNPDYVPYESENDGSDADDDSDEYDSDDGDTDDESDSDDDDDDDEDEDEDLASMLNKALSKTNKIPSETMKFIRENRTTLTIACVLFAFRREIWYLILSVATSPNKDGTRSVKIRISPTAILKIFIFIDVMRKMQGQTADGGAMPVPGRMGLFGLLSDLMKPSNSAFIPPIEQHYTFEKMNDRYNKDGNAFRKAMGMEMPSPAAASSRPFTSRAFPEKNIVQYNGTTIVMEMRGLDTGVSSMEVIRDQVTFILNQHAALQKDKELAAVSNVTNTTESANPTAIKSSNTTASTANATSAVNATTVSTATTRTAHIITTPTEADMEIVILLESPGGSASDYGLAAQQIWRLRNEPGIKVTICVDKVAASGGYMMACMSSPGCLYAAPFAVVGSIGVIGQTINIHKSLQNWGVQPLVFRGGKDKAPVGLVGEVTKEGMEKVQDMVDKTHLAFKRHVALARPIMASTIDEVATGDVWLAVDALKIGLVDGIMTSDSYIQGKILKGERVLKLIQCPRPRFIFGPPSGGFPGMKLLQTSVRSMVETVQEFGSLLKKANALLEDQNLDLSGVASARAMGIGSVQTSMKH